MTVEPRQQAASDTPTRGEWMLAGPICRTAEPPGSRSPVGDPAGADRGTVTGWTFGRPLSSRSGWVHADWHQRRELHGRDVFFTDNYADRSSDDGYQFDFYCAHCVNGYTSFMQDTTRDSTRDSAVQGRRADAALL